MVAKIWLGLLTILVAGEIFEEDDVWILNDQNFEEALQLQSGLLVEFYAPWCAHCRQIAPEFSKAAFALKNRSPSIRIAKIDATVNPLLAEKYGISGYPSLKYVSEEGSINYTGGLTEESIVTWLIKKSQPSPLKVTNLADLEATLRASKVSIVMFAQNTSLDFFIAASKQLEESLFIISVDPAAFDHYGASEGNIVMFKHYDDRKLDYHGNKDLSIFAKWIEDSQRPWVWPYCDAASEYIFKKQHPAIFFFRYEGEAPTYDSMYEKLAKEYKNDLVFTHADLSLPEFRKLSQFLGVPRHAMPTFQIVDHEGGSINKYLFFKAPTENEVRKFILEWKNKEIQPHVKSEAVPVEQYSSGVRIIVARSFEDIVMDPDRDVLVQFYVPWCATCRNLAKDYERLAKAFKGMDSMVIGKLDANLNDVKGHMMQEFPTIKFFPANNKSGIVFVGEPNFETLYNFIKEHASNKIEDEKVKVDL